MGPSLPTSQLAFNGDRLKVDAAFGVNTASLTNSTTTPLGIGASFNGVYESVLDYAQLAITLDSNVDAAAGGLTVTFSTDGVIDHTVLTYDFLTAEGPKSIIIPVVAEFFKVDYTNGGVAQANFELETLLKPMASIQRLFQFDDTLTNTSLAVLTRSHLTGQVAGVYNNVGVNASEELLVSPSHTGFLEFQLDGALQRVIEDTVTPANNIPLPVKLTSITGDVNITANDLNVETSHTSDSMRLGDGTDLTLVNASGDLQVVNDHARSTIRLGDGTTLVDVTVNNELEVKDQGLPATIGTQLAAASTSIILASDSPDLPIEQITHIGGAAVFDSVRIGDGVETANVNASNELLVVTEDATSSVRLGDGTTLTNVTANNELEVFSDHAQGSSIQLGDGTDIALISGTGQLSVKDIGLPASIGTQLAAASTSIILASDSPDLPIEQITHIGGAGVFDSVRIGDGVETANVNASNELLVVTEDARSTMRLGDGTNLTNVNASGDLQAVNTHLRSSIRLGDGTTLTNVTANNELEVFSDHTQGSSIQIGDGTDIALISAAGELSVKDIGLPTAIGTQLAAASTSVILASDSPAIPVSQGGLIQIVQSRNDYTVTPVTTGAWVQLIASTAADIEQLDVFDSSGQTLEFGVGAAASEVRQFYISPGGNGKVSLNIPSGSRVAVRAVSADANVGELVINYFG